jgi:hypothetical protein
MVTVTFVDPIRERSLMGDNVAQINAILDKDFVLMELVRVVKMDTKLV